MKTRIAIDIMSGDAPPEELIKGAARAAGELDLELNLVGSAAYKQIAENEFKNVKFEYTESFSIVTMEDETDAAMKEKTDSSMAIALTLLKEEKADALVSPGNTGALFTAASLKIRRIKGIRRAALGTVVPLENPFILLDVGANTDATPDILNKFAEMGSLYAKGVLGIKNPRVSLLNNGSEEHKGTPLYSETYKLLSKNKNINFTGNCEGRDLTVNHCDVAVCDGFTGNIVLKTIEGMGALMNRKLKELFLKNALTKISALLVNSGIKSLKKQMDHKEYGGAPFLGISKPVIKAHGSSDEKGFYSALKQAKLFYESGIIQKMNNEFNQ